MSKDLAKSLGGLQRVVFDEIHKYPRWKIILKGLVDQKIPGLEIVVTGSSRLDLYQKKGDSLFWNRWRTRRRELLIQQDLRDLSGIRNLALVESLYILLPTKIGTPLSVNKLHQAIDVAHDTVSEWLKYLEQLYILFRISPYAKKIHRALKKEQKAYLWDWSQVSDPVARFENMVASHLLKAIHAWNDLGYGPFDLKYIRNKEKEEVDFLILNDSKPWLLVEAKLSDSTPSSALVKFSSDLGVPAVQILREPGICEQRAELRIESASTFFLRWV